MQLRRLSPRTQQAYLAWILRFIRHHEIRHPTAMGETEVLDFLNWLVVDRKVAYSTRKLPRQVDTGMGDSQALVGLGRNIRGGTRPRLSWGRSVL